MRQRTERLMSDRRKGIDCHFTRFGGQERFNFANSNPEGNRDRFLGIDIPGIETISKLMRRHPGYLKAVSKRPEDWLRSAQGRQQRRVEIEAAVRGDAQKRVGQQPGEAGDDDHFGMNSSSSR